LLQTCLLITQLFALNGTPQRCHDDHTRYEGGNSQLKERSSRRRKLINK
jgi:hypothetical protein